MGRTETVWKCRGGVSLETAAATPASWAPGALLVGGCVGGGRRGRCVSSQLVLEKAVDVRGGFLALKSGGEVCVAVFGGVSAGAAKLIPEGHGMVWAVLFHVEKEG